MSLTVELSDEQTRQLEKKADRYGLSPRELLEAGVEDFLTQPDEQFRKALNRTLDQNHELYDRLS